MDHRSNVERVRGSLTWIVIVLWLLGFGGGYAIGKNILITWPIAAVSFIAVLVLIKHLKRVAFGIKGLTGEYKVSVILDNMWYDDVRSLNNVVLKQGKGDVDHIVVAKTGIWTVETKHSNGEITFVDGQLLRNGKTLPEKYLKQPYAEMEALEGIVSRLNLPKKVSVRPILIFSGKYAKVQCGYEPVQGVIVIGSLGLRKVITDIERYGELLSAEQVEKTYGVISDYFAARDSR